MSEPAREASKNHLPLGDFVQRASTPGLDFVMKASITGFSYEADRPQDKAEIASAVDHALFRGVETTGRVVQALLLAIQRGDRVGFRKIAKQFETAMEILGATTGAAVKNMIEDRPAFPQIEVAGAPTPPKPRILRG